MNEYYDRNGEPMEMMAWARALESDRRVASDELPNGGNNLLDAYCSIGQNPAADRPGRLWCLWDIMNVFDLPSLVKAVRDVIHIEKNCEAMRTTGHGAMGIQARDYDGLLATLGRAMEITAKSGLEDSTQKIAASHVRLSEDRKHYDASSICTELRNVYESILVSTMTRRFLGVRAAYADFVDRDDLFGPKVRTAFPSAHYDIREAGNCLAAECGTAAVFHLMRATEWGLRALAADLGLLRVAKGKTASKRKKYVPLAWAEWESILNQLPEKVDAKIARLRPGAKKQDTQEFYYPALQDIRAMRDAWRNHVMHTRSEYAVDDAAAVLEHVRHLLTRLSTRVSEI